MGFTDSLLRAGALSDTMRSFAEHLDLQHGVATALMSSADPGDQTRGQQLMQELNASLEQAMQQLHDQGEHLKESLDSHAPGEHAADDAGHGWFTSATSDSGDGAHAGPAPIEAAPDGTPNAESLTPLMDRVIELLKEQDDTFRQAVQQIGDAGGTVQATVVATDASGPAELAVDASATTDPHHDPGSPGSGYKDHSVTEEHTVEANVVETPTTSEVVAETVTPEAETHTGDAAGEHGAEHTTEAAADHAGDVRADTHLADAHAGDTTFHAGDTGETTSA